MWGGKGSRGMTVSSCNDLGLAYQIPAVTLLGNDILKYFKD